MTDEKRFEFKRSLLVFGNLAFLTWVLIASASIIVTNQLYGALFLLITAAVVWLVLRRTGCSSCYYCRTCTSGFGRLAGYFFGDRSMKDLGNRTALGFVAVVYFLIVPVPLLYLVSSFLQGVQPLNAFFLACLLLLTAGSAYSWVKPQRRTEAEPVLQA